MYHNEIIKIICQREEKDIFNFFSIHLKKLNK